MRIVFSRKGGFQCVNWRNQMIWKNNFVLICIISRNARRHWNFILVSIILFVHDPPTHLDRDRRRCKITSLFLKELSLKMIIFFNYNITLIYYICICNEKLWERGKICNKTIEDLKFYIVYNWLLYRKVLKKLDYKYSSFSFHGNLIGNYI